MVICRSLGYDFDAANLRLNQSYDLGTGLIFTSNVYCFGKEYYIWACSLSTYQRGDCDHTMDVGITCSGKLFICT